jgi:nickel-dependent lactate racemase
VLQKIKNQKATGVQWQNQILARIQLKNSIYLVSGLEDSIVRDMMMVPIPSIEEGLEQAFQVLGRDAEIAVIPEGPTVLPILEE